MKAEKYLSSHDLTKTICCIVAMQVSTKQLEHFLSLPGHSCEKGCESLWDFHAVLKSRFRRVCIRKSNIVLNLTIVETQHHCLADPSCEVHWIKTYTITIYYRSYSLRNRDQINFDQASVQAGTLHLQLNEQGVNYRNLSQNRGSSPKKQAYLQKEAAFSSCSYSVRREICTPKSCSTVFSGNHGQVAHARWPWLYPLLEPQISNISETWIKSIFPYFQFLFYPRQLDILKFLQVFTWQFKFSCVVHIYI